MWAGSYSRMDCIAATGLRLGATRLTMVAARNRPSAFSSVCWVYSTPPRRPVLAATATSENSRRIACCKVWSMRAIFDASVAMASTSDSSRCFKIAAALSGPRMTSSAASFCTFVIFAMSRAAGSVSAAEAIELFGRRIVAGHPGPQRLGHVIRVFANQLIQHLHGDGRGFGRLVPEQRVAAIPAGHLADRHADRNYFDRGAFEGAPEE